jgi:hypothetical protein
VPAGQIAGVPSRIADLLAAPECWINRDRPTARRLNVRPYVSELRLIPSSRQDGWHGVAVVEMLLWVTPNGTARPGEILELLGLGSLLESGVVLERFVLEICDETTQNGLLPPDFGKSQATLPKERAGVPGNVPDSPSRPTAIVSGPMSFDS